MHVKILPCRKTHVKHHKGRILMRSRSRLTFHGQGQGFMQASQECELGEGDGAGQQRSHEDTGGGSATRLITRQRTPKISASIAEFLGQIEKVSTTKV